MKRFIRFWPEILLLSAAASMLLMLCGCERLGVAAGEPIPEDGLTAAQYNWNLIAGYFWPVALPLVRLIPGVGPAVAEALWAIFATRKQKAADAGQS